ncbi:Zinc import ATP-binding protein ZnuC [Buchnera aphidicola (Neophyllaphis podocarpi)]|uniref:zinc ABC transporter ATP-binding protein ZnuC n=1 Tax=Buchnera aphidicola TaxID=9 RepID=UPI0034645AB1
MKPIIILKKISLKLSNRIILSNISMSLKYKRILTLLGPNGAGKSTLIRIILGLIYPDSGKLIRNPDLKIGYVPQKLNFNKLIPITVNKFMCLNYKVNTDTVSKLLNRVHAIHLQYFKLNSLSVGEMQKILLARALSNKPKLLILDEPTQGVDIKGQLFLYKLINQIRYELNCTILIVSHDLNLIMAKTDDVICINRHVCCSGTPEIISKNLEFISMFGKSALKQLAVYYHNHDV